MGESYLGYTTWAMAGAHPAIMAACPGDTTVTLVKRARVRSEAQSPRRPSAETGPGVV
jgi:hypothetical protein